MSAGDSKTTTKRAGSRALPAHACPSRNRPPPTRKIGSELELFDCVSCDRCVTACPQGANFVYQVEPLGSFAEEACVDPAGTVRVRPGAPFRLEQATQIGHWVERCQECGDCDRACPEDGGPHARKARFFGSLATFRAETGRGGFHLEVTATRVRAWARIAGRDFALELCRASRRATFTDGVLRLALDASTGLVEGAGIVPGAQPAAGHTLSSHPARATLAIVEGVLALPWPDLAGGSRAP